MLFYDSLSSLQVLISPMKSWCQNSDISLIDDRSIKKRLYFDHIAKIGPVNDTTRVNCLLSEEKA